MDTLTHYLISWIFGGRFHLEKNNLRIFLLCSVIPDADAASILVSYTFFQSFHATVTHSIFSGILFVFVFILILNLIYSKSTGYLGMFKFGFAGIMAHNLIDITLNTNFFQTVSTLGIPVGDYIQAPQFTGQSTILWPFSDMKGQLYLHFGYPVWVPFITGALILTLTYSLTIRKIMAGDYPWDVWRR